MCLAQPNRNTDDSRQYKLLILEDDHPHHPQVSLLDNLDPGIFFQSHCAAAQHTPNGRAPVMRLEKDDPIVARSAVKTLRVVSTGIEQRAMRATLAATTARLSGGAIFGAGQERRDRMQMQGLGSVPGGGKL